MPPSQLLPAPEESGEGLPYAPENWPEPGDVWGWKTGRRATPTGIYHDRYLYVPVRLSGSEKGGSGRKHRPRFASKLAAERYIKANFPNADIYAFFASFSWKIPASVNVNAVPIAAVPLQQVGQAEASDSDCGTDVVVCKAGNKMCGSLNMEEVENYSPAMPCDICCSEYGFCRDCCCILCCKTVDSAYGGYSYIKWQVNAGEGICAHVAHMECALRCLLAGTVGKSIGLDAAYHCRRCDGRTDLVSHVDKLLQASKAIDLDDEIKSKILNLGACLLRGSQKPNAKVLLSHIELAISKLKLVTNHEDTWMANDNGMAHSQDHGNDAMEVTMMESYDYLPESLKLDAEVDDVLKALSNSQELEYKMAEERLQQHKKYLQNLYQQLDWEKSELARKNSSSSGVLFNAVRERMEQIRREVTKFEVMKKVANGFGMTSQEILKEHFGLERAD